MITSLSPLRAMYSRQNLASIVIHMLVRCCVSSKISWSAHIYRTLPIHLRLKKKKKSSSGSPLVASTSARALASQYTQIISTAIIISIYYYQMKVTYWYYYLAKEISLLIWCTLHHVGASAKFNSKKDKRKNKIFHYLRKIFYTL